MQPIQDSDKPGTSGSQTMQIDWAQGKISVPDSSAPPEPTLVVCGDWAPLGETQRAMVNDPAGYYGTLLPLLRRADISLINLEGVLGTHNEAPIIKDGISIQFPADLVQGLLAVPFKVACLANNHSFDKGMEGLKTTQEILEQHGIQHIGAGPTMEQASSPYIYQTERFRLAIINVAEGEEAQAGDQTPGVFGFSQNLSQQISSLRESVDFCLVIAHAGREHLLVPAPYIRDLYRSLIDAGADMVIGHHPHVAQGIEIYNNAPIIYSLGNFALYTGVPFLHHYYGYAVTVAFKEKKLHEVELHPYRISKHQLELLSGGERTAYLDHLAQLSKWITTPGSLEAIWEAFADRWLMEQGLDELSDAAAQLSGFSRSMKSSLRTLATSEQDGIWHRRIVRPILWRTIRWLEQRIKRQPVLRPGSGLPKAAAVIRNRFDTPAHRELYLTSLQRVMDRQVGKAPQWANQLLEDWIKFDVPQQLT